MTESVIPNIDYRFIPYREQNLILLHKRANRFFKYCMSVTGARRVSIYFICYMIKTFQGVTAIRVSQCLVG